MSIRLNDPHVRYSAADYDRFTATVIKPFDEAMCPVVVDLASRRMPGAVLLDIGTGTARFLIHVAQHGGLPGCAWSGRISSTTCWRKGGVRLPRPASPSSLSARTCTRWTCPMPSPMS
ncbi:MAG: hypothetical protein R2712_28405 [Vicinamibacterales bacterium]